MRILFAVAFCSVVGLIAASPLAHAQQKTVKACEEEWRANKAANQAAGKTEKAYVAECRGTAEKPAAATTPAAAPAKPAAPAPAATAPKPAPAPAAAAPKPAPSTPSPATASIGANQYTTDTQAKARCPSDTVVWVNLSSKIYHFAGHKDYGNTKNGAYMCEKDTAGAGARAAKNEKHP
jgi:hypothetical protein